MVAQASACEFLRPKSGTQAEACATLVRAEHDIDQARNFGNTTVALNATRDAGRVPSLLGKRGWRRVH